MDEDDIFINIVNNNAKKVQAQQRYIQERERYEQQRNYERPAHQTTRTRGKHEAPRATLKQKDSGLHIAVKQIFSKHPKFAIGIAAAVLASGVLTANITANTTSDTDYYTGSEKPTTAVMHTVMKGQITDENELLAKLVFNSGAPADASQQDKNYGNEQVGEEETKETASTNQQKSPTQRINVTHSREQLSNYLNYSYVDKYGSKDYYYCPDSYLLEISQMALNNVNEQYVNYRQSKGYSVPEDNYALPDLLTPELLAGIAMRESSKTIVAVNGDKRTSVAGAEGMFQHTPVFVDEVSKYSSTHGGSTWDMENSNNPIDAAEMTVWGLLRVYNVYINENSRNSVADRLQGPEEELAYMLGVYNSGEGTMGSLLDKGVFPNMYYDRTNDIGSYASDVIKFQHEYEDLVDNNAFNNTIGFEDSQMQ